MRHDRSRVHRARPARTRRYLRALAHYDGVRQAQARKVELDQPSYRGQTAIPTRDMRLIASRVDRDHLTGHIEQIERSTAEHPVRDESVIVSHILDHAYLQPSAPRDARPKPTPQRHNGDCRPVQNAALE